MSVSTRAWAVRSHRPRRRPGMLVAVAVVVALVGVTVAVIGYRSRAGWQEARCSAATTVTVATSRETLPVLDGLAGQWSAAAGGGCVQVRTLAMSPDEIAAAAHAGGGPARTGDLPDAWLPESSLWLAVAASRPGTAALVPAQTRSIATSPVVLALRQPMAQAMGWPGRRLTWVDVIGAFARPDTWASAGHPEWTDLRVGTPDPARSTAGLAAALMVLDRDASGTVSEEKFIEALVFAQTIGALAPDPKAFVDAQPPAAPAGPNAAVAAFPALERDLAAYNAGNPHNLLVPVYADQLPVVADYPYAVLSGPWVTPARRAAAEQFGRFLLTPAAQQQLAAAGLRAPDRSADGRGPLTSEHGFVATVADPRPTPAPETLNRTISEWANLQRQVNLLAVLDTSGSMRQVVTGTRMTRLQLLQQTAQTGFGLLPNTMSIGLWEFSSREDSPSGYRALVPFGPINGKVGQTPRRQAMAAAVPGMRAGGQTPLYDTAYAAFSHMQQRWAPNSSNAVLLITDGVNETDGGISLSELLNRLRREQRPDRPVQIISIALGTSADAGALKQISAATGGPSFVIHDPAKAVHTLVLAFTGRLQ
jgi:Ca-activated chloride channel homolog